MLILREEKRKKLTFVDVSFDNYYCFVNNLNCSTFIFLLGAQCYDKFGDSYKIFYSNREKKLVFFIQLDLFLPNTSNFFLLLSKKIQTNLFGTQSAWQRISEKMEGRWE